MEYVESTEGGTLHRFSPRCGDKGRHFDAHSYPYARRVDDGIFMITPAVRQIALEGTLLIQDDITVLFDTGLPYAQAEELSSFVDLVVNTHAHLGHTGKNYLFPEVWAFEGEADYIEDFDLAVGFHGFRDQSFEGAWRNMLAENRIGPPSKVARRFADGDVLDFGRTQWQVLLTPGHSPGHCCFYEPNRGVLYAGDFTLTDFGPWYATPSSDIAAFKDSIRRLMALDLRVVATSAKGPFREGIEERFQAFADRFEQRDQAILAELREPRTMDELVHRLLIYGRVGKRPELQPVYLFYEHTMLEKHLAILIAAGLVVFSDGVYRATGG